MNLTDLDAFTPIPGLKDAKVLNNAQIAQIMVRGSECISDQASLIRVAATLSAVRDLRTELSRFLNVKDVKGEVQDLIDLVHGFIDLSEQAQIDVEFDLQKRD